MQQYTERAIAFPCHGSELLGIVAIPERPAATALVVVVGGAQYRVGSHRQFALLARHAAERGVASIRFDYRGMGDSEGVMAPGVTGIGDDIRVAIDALLQSVPGVQDVRLWGLCGAASAAALYAPTDARVTGIAMLNPWVRTREGLARAQIRHYYVARLADRELWRRMFAGEVQVFASIRSMLTTVLEALRGFLRRVPAAGASPADQPIDIRIADGIDRFGGRVLVILSGQDLTANEFRDVEASSPRLRKALQSDRVTRHELPEANHTFARSDWRAQVERWTVDWLRQP